MQIIFKIKLHSKHSLMHTGPFGVWGRFLTHQICVTSVNFLNFFLRVQAKSAVDTTRFSVLRHLAYLVRNGCRR